SMRKALELSTTTAPALTAAGANSLLREPPAENSAMSTPSKLFSVNSSTLSVSPLKVIVLPTEREEARSFRDLTGKFLFSRVLIISTPTAPVAPAIATLYDLLMILLRGFGLVPLPWSYELGQENDCSRYHGQAIHASVMHGTRAHKIARG